MGGLLKIHALGESSAEQQVPFIMSQPCFAKVPLCPRVDLGKLLSVPKMARIL